jgi:hypothetical protein
MIVVASTFEVVVLHNLEGSSTRIAWSFELLMGIRIPSELRSDILDHIEGWERHVMMCVVFR